MIMATKENTLSTSPVEHMFSVGYALSPNKVDTVIQPSLLTYAKNHGIDLIQVDLDKPLIDQGPFVIILHKIYGEDWNRQLQAYKSKHPHVMIIDSLEYIQRLQNRISMLDVVNRLSPFPSDQRHGSTFGIPNQVVINDGNSSSLDLEYPINFPVIAKPLMADGTANSHHMCLIFNSNALNKFKPPGPMVLQEFVNHGGLLFKVYVAGDHVRCVKRRSLPDFIQGYNLENNSDGILPFSQISNVAEESEAEMPPLDFVHHIAQGLRHESKLHLFNFDMIRDASMPTRYLIIDINFFPGYAKLPGFETMLTDFLLDLLNLPNKLCANDEGCHQEKEEQGTSDSDSCVTNH